MKRLIAVIVVAVFCVSLFSPPLAARDRDPTKPLPWTDPSARPNGDGGGWNDIDSEGGDGIVVFFDLFKIYGSKIFIIYLPSKSDNSVEILTSAGRKVVSQRCSSARKQVDNK